MDNYNELITILKNKFTKWEAFDIINENTKEHIGESYIFKPILEVEKDPTKFNQISISYKLEYKIHYIESKNEFVNTSDVDEFVIDIEYYNIYGTKLTTEGSL